MVREIPWYISRAVHSSRGTVPGVKKMQSCPGTRTGTVVPERAGAVFVAVRTPAGWDEHPGDRWGCTPQVIHADGRYRDILNWKKANRIQPETETR